MFFGSYDDDLHYGVFMHILTLNIYLLSVPGNKRMLLLFRAFVEHIFPVECSTGNVANLLPCVDYKQCYAHLLPTFLYLYVISILVMYSVTVSHCGLVKHPKTSPGLNWIF